MSTQLLTAAGSAFSFGPNPLIINKRAVSLTATGSAQSAGTASVIRKLPVGGLTDFGLWHSGQPDTAMSRDMAHSVGSDPSASRSWLAASAPTAYAPGGTQLWNEAVYAGIGIKWTGMASGERHSFDNIQLEDVSAGNRLSWDATSWEGRRCYVGQENSTFSEVDVSTDTFFSGTSSGKITYTGALPGSWGYTINPTSPTGMAACVPGEILSGSVSLSMERAAWWSAGLQFYDSGFNQLGSGTWYFSTYQQHPGTGQWDTSYVYSITAPASSAWVAVVPHISVNSTPAATDSIALIGEVSYCDMNRIWGRGYNIAGTPTPYIAPRKLSVKVQANRVNLINNPGFDSDVWGWGSLGIGTAPNPNSWDSTTGRSQGGSLRWTMAPNPASYGLDTLTGVGLLTGWSTAERGGFGWQVSTTYTSSVYVKLGNGCPPVSLYCGGYTPIAGVLSTDDALASHPELVEGEWIRLWGTFSTSPSDDGLVGLDVILNSADLPAQGATFWVDDTMSELGDQALPYFDGGSPGADYLWAGSASRSSSHYYRGFRSNAYRLNDIVRSVAPHGTQFELLYAQPPE